MLIFHREYKESWSLNFSNMYNDSKALIFQSKKKESKIQIFHQMIMIQTKVKFQQTLKNQILIYFID